MKSQKDFRTNQTQAADSLRKAVKLEPIRKSGKVRHEIYKGISHSDDEEDDEEYSSIKKRESILDYMGDEEEEYDDEEDEDEDEEEDEDDESGEDEE